MLDASEVCVVPVVPFGSFAASAPVQTVMTNPKCSQLRVAERKCGGGLGELIGDAMRPVIRTARPEDLYLD